MQLIIHLFYWNGMVPSYRLVLRKSIVTRVARVSDESWMNASNNCAESNETSRIKLNAIESRELRKCMFSVTFVPMNGRCLCIGVMWLTKKKILHSEATAANRILFPVHFDRFVSISICEIRNRQNAPDTEYLRSSQHHSHDWMWQIHGVLNVRRVPWTDKCKFTGSWSYEYVGLGLKCMTYRHVCAREHFFCRIPFPAYSKWT